MNKVSFKSLGFIPASHEDKNNPANLKKVLLARDNLMPGRIQMVNWAILSSGRTFTAHYHEDLEEIFIVLTGKVTMVVGKSKQYLEKGDTMVVSPNETHSMQNNTSEDIEYIVIGISKIGKGKTIIVE